MTVGQMPAEAQGNVAAPAASPRGRLDRVDRGGGGVGASGRDAPGQYPRLRLLEPPSLGLLAPVMMSAEGRIDALADTPMTWNNSADRRLGAAESCAVGPGGRSQIIQFWAFWY
jgi:hypothetical protein